MAESEPTPEIESIRSQHRLLGTQSRLAIGVAIEGERLLAFSCDKDCTAGKGELLEELPSSAASLKKSVRTLELKNGARVMWLRFGPDENAYSLLLAGARRPVDGGLSSPPVVFLRGWGGQGSKSGSELIFEKLKGGPRLLLKGAAQKALCGREISSSIRIYDPEKARFKAVKAPLLSKDARRKATVLSLEPAPVNKNELLLRLFAATPFSAREVVDADKKEPWNDGHEFAELRAPAGQQLDKLVIAVPAPLTANAQVWLATESRVFRVELLAGSGTSYNLDIPGEDAPACLAIVQGRKPAPLSEIMLRLEVERVPTTEELIMQLSKADPGLASEALSLRGLEAAFLLAKAYARMSKMTRARATELAETMPAESRSIIQVAALEYGSEAERESSLASLLQVREPAVATIVARLPKSGRAGRLRLSAGLAKLSPADAIAPLSLQLGRGSSAERLYLRRIFSKLASEKEAGPALDALIARQSRKGALPRKSQIALLRALLPRLKSLGPSLPSLLVELSRDASFEEAYRLGPAALLFASEEPALEKLASSWLRGELSRKPSESQRAALSVRMLELLDEGDFERGEARFLGEVSMLVSAENMQVRRAAFALLAKTASSSGEEAVIVALRKDGWPQVRAAAADAASAFQPSSAAGQELSRILSRRISRDDHPTARRAMARSLGRLGGEKGTKALRKSLRKDSSYEVRAEAALSLGRLCDQESLGELTQYAQELAKGAAGDGPILLGLSSVTALTQLNPPDLEERISPLLSKKSSGVLRNQVELRRERASLRSCPQPSL